MIRFALTFPAHAHPDAVKAVMKDVAAAAGAREAVDLAIMDGVRLERISAPAVTRARIRIARARRR